MAPVLACNFEKSGTGLRPNIRSPQLDSYYEEERVIDNRERSKMLSLPGHASSPKQTDQPQRTRREQRQRTWFRHRTVGDRDSDHIGRICNAHLAGFIKNRDCRREHVGREGISAGNRIGKSLISEIDKDALPAGRPSIPRSFRK
jgi:hypothetical protein